MTLINFTDYSLVIDPLYLGFALKNAFFDGEYEEMTPQTLQMIFSNERDFGQDESGLGQIEVNLGKVNRIVLASGHHIFRIWSDRNKQRAINYWSRALSLLTIKGVGQMEVELGTYPEETAKEFVASSMGLVIGLPYRRLPVRFQPYQFSGIHA